MCRGASLNLFFLLNPKIRFGRVVLEKIQKVLKNVKNLTFPRIIAFWFNNSAYLRVQRSFSQSIFLIEPKNQIWKGSSRKISKTLKNVKNLTFPRIIAFWFNNSAYLRVQRSFSQSIFLIEPKNQIWKGSSRKNSKSFKKRQKFDIS